MRRGCSEAYGRVDAEGEDGEDGGDDSITHDIWSEKIEDQKERRSDGFSTASSLSVSVPLGDSWCVS